MLEDKILLLKFKFGSKDALAGIYKKYRKYLLRLSTALLHQTEDAEDIVHDVFVSFAQSEEKIKLRGSLKSYLATCVVNRTRNFSRAQRIRTAACLDENCQAATNEEGLEHWIICNEESRRLSKALAELAYEQRETVVLHIQGEMKFKEIAEIQNVSINTVQSRYRYGIEKLRTILDSEAKK